MLLLGQIPMQYQNNTIYIEFSMDVDMGFVPADQSNVLEHATGTIDVFVTVEVSFEEIPYNQKYPGTEPHPSPGALPPGYLLTWSLAGIHPVETTYQKFKEQMDYLLAMNDPTDPKADTLVDWLQPVRHQQYNQLNTINIPMGFGPLISL